jgi:hypothetical protein
MNVHNIHKLLYEQDMVTYEKNCLSTEKDARNASKRLKSLKHRNLKKR